MTSTDPDAQRLTAEERAKIEANRCSHCGGTHIRACPRVRRMAYHPNGNLAEVEFWPDGKWSIDYVVSLDALPEPDAEGGDVP